MRLPVEELRPGRDGAELPGPREGAAEGAPGGKGRGGGGGRSAALARLALLPLLVFLLWRSFVVLSQVPIPVHQPTPLFEDSKGGFLSDGQAVYGALGYWSMPEPLPDKVTKTLVAIEDRRFYSHPGVDPWGIARAVAHNARGRLEGASTIAMQVVRLGHPRPRNLLAKAEEAASALLATALYGREGILRAYLQMVPEGGTMYGLSYASRRVFDKPAEDLSWAETALLLAVPQDPRGRDLFGFVSFLKAKDRANAILGQLSDQGVIDRDELSASRTELADIRPLLRETRREDAYHYIFRVLEDYGESPHSRIAKPIRTSLDPEIQDRVTALAQRYIPHWRSLGADNLAVIVADAKTGEVLSYLGSLDYFDAEHHGAIDFARVPRSSGSTLKPFLYALGLQSGAFGPGSILSDMPLRLKDARGEYGLVDFDDSYLGPLPYRVALGNSRNVPAIRVLEGVGLDEAWRWLGHLGLHDFEYPSTFYGYGLAVGGLYTSLDRLVSAYGCLANDGWSLPLLYLADENPTPRTSLVSESAARMISLFLSDTDARLPSFAGTALTHFPFPVAVKTGTSNGFRDAWALGYSRRYVVGIWTGNADALGTNHLAGSTVATFLLEIFKALQPEAVQGLGEEPFPAPRGWEAARICPVSGKLAGDYCPSAIVERFPPGAAPREECQVHRRVIVDARTGNIADLATPAEERVARNITVLDPEYASFAASRGYSIPPGGAAALAQAAVSLTAPIDGTRVRIDPDTPRRFQTLALRATVSPAVPEVVWLVDGKEFAREPYPYEARWPLAAGSHSFQVRFPHAFIESRPVRVTVLAN